VCQIARDCTEADAAGGGAADYGQQDWANVKPATDWGETTVAANDWAAVEPATDWGETNAAAAADDWSKPPPVDDWGIPPAPDGKAKPAEHDWAHPVVEEEGDWHKPPVADWA
jgi:hypothetical protein